MTLEQARALVDYHCWARERLLDAVALLNPEQFTRSINSSFPSVRATLVHLYGAECVWIARWHGESPSAFPDCSDLHDLAACAPPGAAKRIACACSLNVSATPDSHGRRPTVRSMGANTPSRSGRSCSMSSTMAPTIGAR